MAGDRDIFCSVEEGFVTYRTLPAGEFGVVPNAGHEITPAVIDTMIDFLTRHVADE